MAKECMLSTGKPSLGGLPNNSVVKITDRRDMTTAVYHERKASTQPTKHLFFYCVHIDIIQLDNVL